MKKFDKLTDSGQREEFTTGSVRDKRTGKGRFDLIPPYALFRIARHYENGAVKYSERNWEKGQPLHCYIESAQRHINSFLMGDDSEDHLAAATWNLMGYIETEIRIKAGLLPKELDDLSEHRNSLKGLFDYIFSEDKHEQ